jgi:hypothetical protein
MNRAHVAWDIETTGFTLSDRVTVSGFWLPDGRAKLLLNTAGASVDSEHIEQILTKVSGGVQVDIIPTGTEQALLEQMKRFLFEYFERDYNKLVAFNAETWKSGFDLPFVRTRCALNGVNWVFDGIQFSDLWEPVEKRLNTTYSIHGKTDSVNSLTESHRLLSDGLEGLGAVLDVHDEHVWYSDYQYDPFGDSGSAVSHYDRGDFSPVCQHNLADIHRTWELSELIQRFVSKKDMSTKKL